MKTYYVVFDNDHALRVFTTSRGANRHVTRLKSQLPVIPKWQYSGHYYHVHEVPGAR